MRERRSRTGTESDYFKVVGLIDDTKVNLDDVSHLELHGKVFFSKHLVSHLDQNQFPMTYYYLVWWEMWLDVSSVLFWLPGVEWLKPDGTCTTFYSVNILALGFPTWPQVSVVCIANPIIESTIQNMTKSHLIMIWSHAPSTGQNEKFLTLFLAPP